MSIITSRNTIMVPTENIHIETGYEPVYIIDQDERLRRRKNKILGELDTSKLENSRAREGKISINDSYSLKQMKNILMSIGINTSGQKVSYIDTLLELRYQYDIEKMKFSN